MDLYYIATSLSLNDVIVKAYFKDSSKNCKFKIFATKFCFSCCSHYDSLVLKDVSRFKFNVKRHILSLYYED